MAEVAKCLVTLVGATGLKAQDPYCVLRIGSSTYKSKTVKENPVLKEECLLSATVYDRYLCVDVLDSTRVPGKDEKLGDVLVSLFQIPVHHDHETPMSLALDLPLRGDADKNKNPVGRLQFSVAIRWLDLDHWAAHQAAAWRLQGWSGNPSLEPAPPQYTLVNADSRHIHPECVEIFLPYATVRTPSRYSNGWLFLSYCRLVFVSELLRKDLESVKEEISFIRPRIALSTDLSFAIPVGLILSVELTDPCTVRVETIDLNVFQICFPIEQVYLMDSFMARLEAHTRNRGDNIVAKELYAAASALVARAASPPGVSSYTSPPPHSTTLPIPDPTITRSASGSSSGHVTPIALETTLRFDFISEVRRQGLDLSVSAEKEATVGTVATRRWRLSTANMEYSLCPTYPQFLIVPCAITDEVLSQVGLYRSKGRIPALSYFHRRRGTAISRCAQPLAGLIGKSSDPDQKLIQAIRQASPGGKLTIIDARSPVAAHGNSIKGAGTENVRDFPGCEMQFMYIGNIHDMRNSFNAVREAVFNDEFHQDLATSKWLKHVSAVIHAACIMVKLLEEPVNSATCACGIKFETGSEKPCPKCGEVQLKGLTATSCLVHCSDGWDRTAQICSLAQLLLDPYSRTFDGFRMLVQKDWLSFGHKFYDRLGHTSHPDEESPIFWQWLDCVHQMVLQFPTAFEFTTSYLAAVARFTYSGWCGEFMRNTERERAAEHNTMISLWTLLKPYQRLYNPRYTPTEGVLLPVSSQKALVFWSEVYLRYAIPPDDVEVDTSYEAKGLDAKLKKMKEKLPEQLSTPSRVEGFLHSAVQGAQSLTSSIGGKKGEDSDSCGICSVGFTILRRRRKCPGCETSVCSSCSPQSVPSSAVQGPENGPDVRVCTACYQTYAVAILRGTRPALGSYKR